VPAQRKVTGQKRRGQGCADRAKSFGAAILSFMDKSTASGAGSMLAPDIFDRITAWENLLAAWRAARKGKRRSAEVAAFEADLEANLVSIHEHLLRGTWQPGQPRRFYVRDPKWREITAPPFADRIVHHAIVRVIEPLFERRFIHDSYACRPGKGVHAAVDRLHRFMRGAARRWPNAHLVRCDIASYFASIDHRELIDRLRRVIQCERTMALIRTAITAYGYRDVGLPIGALTSQLFANVMLDTLDHIIKDDLGIKWYVRYMDDFVVLCEGKDSARHLMDLVVGTLGAMGLRLNPKSGIWPIRRGCTFCGYRVLPTHVAVTQAAKRRWRRRLRTTAYEYRRGRIDLSRCRETVLAMTAVFKHARAARSQAAMLRSFTL